MFLKLKKNIFKRLLLHMKNEHQTNFLSLVSVSSHAFQKTVKKSFNCLVLIEFALLKKFSKLFFGYKPWRWIIAYVVYGITF
jgi:hypothetical protein